MNSRLENSHGRLPILSGSSLEIEENPTVPFRSRRRHICLFIFKSLPHKPLLRPDDVGEMSVITVGLFHSNRVNEKLKTPTFDTQDKKYEL